MMLLANSKSGERYHKKDHYSLLGREYQPLLVLEKNRTSLRESNSPTMGHALKRTTTHEIDVTLPLISGGIS